MIHMKNQALFSSKDISKKLKCRLLQFLFGALRVKCGQLIKEIICLSESKFFSLKVDFWSGFISQGAK